MASEQIIVYIDPAQVKAQKQNNYSLFLAKKVNGAFTVIWQSMGPIATVNQPSYEYKNTFIIDVPSYQVNYGNPEQTAGGVSFSSSGQAVDIDIQQTVILDDDGLFQTPQANSLPGVIMIQNQLAANPHEALLDAQGNPIFFNALSGMDIGPNQLTPIDVYQLWFGSYQDTGTIIANNESEAGVVTFAGGEATQTISYTAAGTWENAPGGAATDVAVPRQGFEVIVTATFATMLSAAAVAYIARSLMSKFAGELRPSSLKVSVGATSLEVRFDNAEASELLGDVPFLTVYEKAVEAALLAAKKDPKSSLAKESWKLSQPGIVVKI